MLHPYTELRFIDHKIGYGVVATRLIPRGTLTWVRDDFDQTFSAEQVKDMTPIYRDLIAKYAFVAFREKEGCGPDSAGGQNADHVVQRELLWSPGAH